MAAKVLLLARVSAGYRYEVQPCTTASDFTSYLTCIVKKQKGNIKIIVNIIIIIITIIIIIIIKDIYIAPFRHAPKALCM